MGGCLTYLNFRSKILYIGTFVYSMNYSQNITSYLILILLLIEIMVATPEEWKGSRLQGNQCRSLINGILTWFIISFCNPLNRFSFENTMY